LQPGQDAEKRRLAAAIASHQPDAIALLDAERGVFEDGALAVANYDVGGGEDGWHFNLTTDEHGYTQMNAFIGAVLFA
jgi:hypothetical protein